MNKLIVFSILFIALSFTSKADAQCTVNGRLIGGAEHWPGTLVVASGQTTTTTRVNTDGTYSFRLHVGEYRLQTRWERDPRDEGWPMFKAVSSTVDAYSRTINCRDQDVIRGVDFALRQDYRNNNDECLIWCASSGSCAKCSVKSRCGRGFTGSEVFQDQVEESIMHAKHLGKTTMKLVTIGVTRIRDVQSALRSMGVGRDTSILRVSQG